MKISVVGGGNAGLCTALHYAFYTRHDKKIEVELIHDPGIDTFPVGQATTLDVVNLLWLACGTTWYDNAIRATPKLGILYENWSKKNPNIYHAFPYKDLAMQVDPKYFQRYLLDSGWFDVKEENVTDFDKLDTNVIFDCRGRLDLESHGDVYDEMYCPVNSVLLAVGPQDKLQLWSRHAATPDGWTFIIPNTTDTLSYGYLYNSDITSLETAQTNFKELYPDISESYSEHFGHTQEIFNLAFRSYIAKEPVRVDDAGRKIILNGNRLGFLEPMESTSIGMYLAVSRFCFEWIVGLDGVDRVMQPYHTLSPHAINEMNKIQTFDVTSRIKNYYNELYTFILWHYVKGSVYDTPFWEYAKRETPPIFEEFKNFNFDTLVKFSNSLDYTDCRNITDQPPSAIAFCEFAQWPPYSIKLWYDEYINA